MSHGYLFITDSSQFAWIIYVCPAYMYAVPCVRCMSEVVITFEGVN